MLGKLGFTSSSPVPPTYARTARRHADTLYGADPAGARVFVTGLLTVMNVRRRFSDCTTPTH
jgi:hypothetical protein